MRLYLVGVGKLRPPLREVTDDYLRRLGRVLTVEEREAREAGQASTPELRRGQEDERVLRLIPEGTDITLLDVGGTGWSSELLATHLQRWRESARDRALVIGGADGVGSAVRARATERSTDVATRNGAADCGRTVVPCRDDIAGASVP